jgi:hypothetical protein
MQMETYIVRVYRNTDAQLAGMLEAVEEGWQRPFRDVAGLMAVLEQASGHSRAAGHGDDAGRSMYSRGEARRAAV